MTAYQFIRNCGNKMSVEPPENRTALAQEIWNTLKERGMQFFNLLMKLEMFSTMLYIVVEECYLKFSENCCHSKAFFLDC